MKNAEWKDVSRFEMTGSGRYKWPTDLRSARADQEHVRKGLRIHDCDLGQIRSILAVGVGYSSRRRTAVAVAVPMNIRGGRIDQNAVFSKEVRRDFPYVPGLFVYREGPAILALLDVLPGLPDFLVFCSQGTAHPRGFGLAAHIGVMIERPTLGITRKLLFGRATPPESIDRGISSVIDSRGMEIGLAVRLLAGCDPIYGSPGHRSTLQTLREFLKGVTEVRACFPEALAVAQERANHIAFRATI
jgi:deoxyribonuclease V